MKTPKFGLIFTLSLAAFTAYISLDTFVLSSAYQKNATQMNTAMFQAEAADSAGFTSAAETADSTEITGAAAAADSAEVPSESLETSDSSRSTHKPSSSGDSKSSHGPRSKSGTDSSSGGSMSHSRPGSEAGSGHESGSGKRTGSQADDSSLAAGDSQEDSDAGTPALTGGEVKSYEDGNIRITLTEQELNGTTVYVADVELSSAEYLKTAFAQDTYGKNVTETTSSMAASNDALLAINGDYYGVQERGYVIRNGVVYRDTAAGSDVLCVYADGTLEIIDPETISAQELVEQGVWQAFSFGPGLVEDGAVSVSENEEVGRAKASNPRTAIGMIDPLHYIFVVSDGRTDESEGLSLYELACFMQQLGATTAYNLDGGGSSTMVFQGEVVNNPTSGGNRIKERGVSDIVYIG